ncbi:conserved hypothetical protein [Anaeromyxobacter dehalogenans 2CP-1]|uniref:LTD domain-containing protein n=1 Tax=Anaeromyxobacter dehalogenans (strain ATCC BAA-258 / DSM 21875 / 2CP-1) TaxID=455488 RepID=B8JCW2_ANAD2|nr:lamin tail domain-containing protein [Anaeromyxobacter dehalogenans]ACL63990.1 conserved hypothetical protein [Anaeromyxobacter dehalogenans 2CP-1]
MSGRRAGPVSGRRAALPAVIWAAALAAGCGLPEAAPHVRVIALEPAGPGVAPELAEAAVTFSAPVDPAGLADGARLVLVPADAMKAALDAVESEEGGAGLAQAVPARAALDADGTRAVLRPDAPLRAHAGYALVLSSRARAADGRPVLDADGRRRPSIATFETGAAAGPPPAPALTEVRADAATPEAGGEYAELANLGEGPLDLYGHRLAKRTSTGGLSSCALPPDAVVAPGEVVVLAGGAYDGRYALPAGTRVLACGATALLGGIANDRPPELLLLDGSGAMVASFGAAGVAPVCAEAAAVKRDPAGPDVAANLACAAGSPGAL